MKKIIPFIILTTATGCNVDGVTNSDEKLEHKIAKALEQNKTPHENQHPVNIYLGQYPTTSQHVEQRSTPRHTRQHSIPQHIETPNIPAPPPIPKNFLPSGLHSVSEKEQRQMLQKQSNLIGELNNTLKQTQKPSLVKRLLKSKKGDQ